MNSRGAATECSPGRKPGVFFRDDLSPGGAKDSFAPPGLCSKTTPPPGLRPGPHSVAAPRLNTDARFSASSLERSLSPHSELGQVCFLTRLVFGICRRGRPHNSGSCIWERSTRSRKQRGERVCRCLVKTGNTTQRAFADTQTLIKMCHTRQQSLCLYSLTVSLFAIIGDGCCISFMAVAYRRC